MLDRPQSAWVIMATEAITVPVVAAGASRVVERSQKALDFGITLYVMHLVICVLFGEVPWNWEWWVIHGVGMVAMVEIMALLCLRSENEEIVMPYHGPASKTPGSKSLVSVKSSEFGELT